MYVRPFPTELPIASCALSSVKYLLVDPSESPSVFVGMSEVNATVPEASLNVIVRSAVGSVIVSVVSKSFAVEPSNEIEDSNTPTAAGADHSTPYVAPEFAVST